MVETTSASQVGYRGRSNYIPPTPLVGAAQGYQRFPLSKPSVRQNIALDAVPAYGASIPIQFLPSQIRFLQISPNL